MLTERLQLSPLCSVVSGVNEIIEQLKKEGKDLDKRLSAREKAEAHGDFYSACFLTRASDTELSSACSHACMPGCLLMTAIPLSRESCSRACTCGV